MYIQWRRRATASLTAPCDRIQVLYISDNVLKQLLIFFQICSVSPKPDRFLRGSNRKRIYRKSRNIWSGKVSIGRNLSADDGQLPERALQRGREEQDPEHPLAPWRWDHCGQVCRLYSKYFIQTTVPDITEQSVALLQMNECWKSHKEIEGANAFSPTCLAEI